MQETNESIGLLSTVDVGWILERGKNQDRLLKAGDTLQEIGKTTVKLIFREAAYASMLQEQDRSLLAPRIMETLITADDVGGTWLYYDNFTCKLNKNPLKLGIDFFKTTPVSKHQHTQIISSIHPLERTHNTPNSGLVTKSNLHNSCDFRFIRTRQASCE